MYKFGRATWSSLDLNKIYDCTHRSKQKALETLLQNDYNAPTSNGIPCSCCNKIITASTLHLTLEESARKRRPGKPMTHRK